MAPVYSISSVFDNLFNTFDAMDNFVYTTSGTAPAGTWNTNHVYTHPLSVDDIISTLKEKGLGGSDIAAFERAKSVYRDLPTFPAVDVYVDKSSGNLQFDIALPGYADDDIEIAFEDDHMAVTVQKDNAFNKKKKEQQDDIVYIRRSLRTSKVNFKVPVPTTRFQVAEAKASYKNGILSISIPRREEHAPVKLKLNGNSKMIEE